MELFFFATSTGSYVVVTIIGIQYFLFNVHFAYIWPSVENWLDSLAGQQVSGNISTYGIVWCSKAFTEIHGVSFHPLYLLSTVTRGTTTFRDQS